MESPTVLSDETAPKLPKNSKENRYYYRNREAILERKKLKRLEDPEFQALQMEKEEKKRIKEEERQQKMKEKSSEKARKKAELLDLSMRPRYVRRKKQEDNSSPDESLKDRP